jgi:hypothetical protein
VPEHADRHAFIALLCHTWRLFPPGWSSVSAAYRAAKSEIILAINDKALNIYRREMSKPFMFIAYPANRARPLQIEND